MNIVDGPTLAYLDLDLWKQFNDPQIELNEFASTWLALQCAMITGGGVFGCCVTHGCLVSKVQDTYTPLAFWPQGSQASVGMSAAAELAIREQRGVVYKPADQADSKQEVPIAYPLVVDGALQGVVVLAVRTSDGANIGAAMRQLQWGMASLENHWRRTRAPDTSQLVTALQLTAAGLDANNGIAAAFSIATDLATILACESVAIGFKVRDHVQLAALSHNANFDKRSSRVRAMTLAMDEALDQKDIVCFPARPQDQLKIARAHKEVLAVNGTGSICTLPLIDRGKLIGAVSLEHHDANYFDADKVALCQRLIIAVGPVLEVKRLESRWIGAKVVDTLTDGLQKFFGPRRYGLKLIAVGLLFALIFVQLAVTDYRVAAPATLEGWQQRHIPAAIDGYIAKSHAKAGDLVKAGQLLFELDDRELQLEKVKWTSQKEQLQKKYVDALAQRDMLQVGVLDAQAAQAVAQLNLINEQLARIRVVAPFDGVVVAGDLSQKINAPVKRGDLLMQIAPLDHYRVILAVNENDIAQLHLGQKGVVNLASFPDQTFAFTLRQITPVAEEKEGVNSFLVEGQLDEGAGTLNLRPGMQGTGKVSVGERKLSWIWTHGLVDWLKLSVWRWWK